MLTWTSTGREYRPLAASPRAALERCPSSALYGSFALALAPTPTAGQVACVHACTVPSAMADVDGA